jgi:GntR family uxuAB operon transcriptional repressor
VSAGARAPRPDATTALPPGLAASEGSGLGALAAIRSEIESGHLSPGDRLPTERALASYLGVTRAAVRRALALLEAEGLISREVGRGTFVHQAIKDPYGPGDQRLVLGSHPDDIGPADVMAVRLLIEPSAIPLVVAWATPRELTEMERCLRGADGASSYEEFEAWDTALHRTIVAATHNRLLVRMYSLVDAARGGPLWGALKRRGDSRLRRAEYQRDHWALVAALKDRDAERATEAMQAHLRRVEANLLGTGDTPEASTA